MEASNRIITTYTGLTIYPYRKKQCPLLEKWTSASRYPKQGRIPFNGFYIKPKTFATHPFDIDILKKNFPNYEIIPAVSYQEDSIIPFKFHDNISFTDIQLSFSEQMMRLHNNRVFCNLQTGYGKTFIGIYMISQILKRTIIICYSTKVLQQWISSLEKHTTFDIRRSLLLQSSQMLDKIRSGKKDVSQIDIFLCTPSLIGSYAKKYGWTAISDLFESLHIGVKLYDEAHRFVKVFTLIDAFTNVKRNYYLSADYSQANQERRKLFFQSFRDVPIVSIDKNNEELEKRMRYIDAVVINFNSHPNELDEMQIQNPQFGFSNHSYMKYEFEKEELLNAIYKVLDTIIAENKDGKKILIATTMIKHVELLYENLKDRYPSYHPARLYSELSQEEKAYAFEKSDMIIATIGSFGPGIDIHGIRYVLGLDQFDMITDNQLSGRARPNQDGRAFYFMFNDEGFAYCNTKIQRRLSYLTKSKLNKIFYIKV